MRPPSPLAFLLLLAVCIGCPKPSSAQPTSGVFQVTNIVSGLNRPTTMAFLDHNDFLILEQQTGKVQRVQLPGPVITTVLQLATATGSEEGMLGIARHPDFSGNQWVYIYHTDPARDRNQIVRYKWNGTRFSSRQFLVSFPRSSRHNGGIITFGPDGKLYAVVGDTQRSSKTTNTASAPLLSVAQIVRINDDGSVPVDNPFTEPGWERIYAYGIRNSFGLSFDPLTGQLWDTENGDTSYDEINRVLAGMNSGWSTIMGPDARSSGNAEDLVMIPGAVYADPNLSFAQTIAPTAICFVSTPRFPPFFRDSMFVASGNNRGIYFLRMNADRTSIQLTSGLEDGVYDPGDSGLGAVVSNAGTASDLKIGPDGYLYLVSNSLGAVYRVRPTTPMGDLNFDRMADLADVPIIVNLLLNGQYRSEADFDANSIINGIDIAMFTDSIRLPN